MRASLLLLPLLLWCGSAHAQESSSIFGGGLGLHGSGINSGAQVNVQSGDPDTVVGVVTERAFAMSGRGSAMGVAWKDQCTVPCTFALRPGVQELVFRGSDFTYFKRLRLREGENNLFVDPGSSGMRTGGMILGTVGFLGLLVGGSLLITRAILPETEIDGRPNSFREKTTWALPLTIAGGVSIGGGITLFYLGRIKVEETGPQQARSELLLQAQSSF